MKKSYFFILSLFFIFHSHISVANSQQSGFANYGLKNLVDKSLKRYEEQAREKIEYCRYNPCNFKSSRNIGSYLNEYYIEKNVDGKFIILDDGSVYQVEDIDTFTASFWLESSNILVTDTEDKMINLDDNEVIEVYRVK